MFHSFVSDFSRPRFLFITVCIFAIHCASAPPPNISNNMDATPLPLNQVATPSVTVRQCPECPPRPAAPPHFDPPPEPQTTAATSMDADTTVKNDAAAEQHKIDDTLQKRMADEFLIENRQRKDVIETQSGLQYRILRKGDGPIPNLNDKVTVHYRGFLLTGKEFDSSYKRQRPATFPVSRVIRGWTEALQLMHKGAKWELYIPSHLAYGERGASAEIPAGAVLVFEVELLDIIPQESATRGPTH